MTKLIKYFAVSDDCQIIPLREINRVTYTSKIGENKGKDVTTVYTELCGDAEPSPHVAAHYEVYFKNFELDSAEGNPIRPTIRTTFNEAKAYALGKLDRELAEKHIEIRDLQARIAQLVAAQEEE